MEGVEFALIDYEQGPTTKVVNGMCKAIPSNVHGWPKNLYNKDLTDEVRKYATIVYVYNGYPRIFNYL